MQNIPSPPEQTPHDGEDPTASDGSPGDRPARRRFFQARGSSLWVGLGGVLAVLAVVEAVARSGMLPARWFPPITVVFDTLIGMLPTGMLWLEVGRTLQGWGIGLGIAALLGVPLGMLIGSVDVVYRGLRAVIEFLRPIPSVALIPAAVLIFGIGMGMKIFLVAFASFWPLLFQAIYGVQDVDPAAKETARAYGLGPLARFRRVILPGTLAYVATGLRISSAVALILAVTAELVVGADGLGRAIVAAQTAAQVPRMYAFIVVTGMLGWLLNTAFQSVETSVLHWHPAHRLEVAT